MAGGRSEEARIYSIPNSALTMTIDTASRCVADDEMPSIAFAFTCSATHSSLGESRLMRCDGAEWLGSDSQHAGRGMLATSTPMQTSARSNIC
jgi:hypothetical protein